MLFAHLPVGIRGLEKYRSNTTQVTRSYADKFSRTSDLFRLRPAHAEILAFPRMIDNKRLFG